MAGRSDKTRVYVGDLGSGGSKPELEGEFERYGPLKSVWVARNPPGFAFIEFEDPRDAEDAVRDMDGRRVCGVRIKCEMAKGSSRPGGNNRYDRNGGPGGDRFRKSPPRPRYERRRSRSRSRSPTKMGGSPVYRPYRGGSPDYRGGRGGGSPDFRRGYSPYRRSPGY